jgi:phosphate transport system substrate-binding protein
MMKRIVTQAALLAALATGVASAQQILINGAGATFPYPMYSKWFDAYHQKFPNLAFNYQSIGSGGGIKQVTEGTVDFGASDGPMNDMQIKEFRDKHGFGILHFPTVMGADVPVYNVAGVSTDLVFTSDALAGIFLGKINKWNDPELMKANPGVKLPAADIVVVHRSDGSGTTYIWTDYLSKVSKEWETKAGRGTSVNWPVGLGGKGNEGVSGQVQQTPNSIGYVELIYAVQNKMKTGKVKNVAGAVVEASLASVTAAAASSKEMPEDFRVSITNAPGKDAYPISSFTWLLIPEKIADPVKNKAIKDFVKWMLADGQTMTSALAYAPLPKAVVAKEIKSIAKIQ